MDSSRQQRTPTEAVAFLMRRTPMLRIVAALSAGILLAEYLPPLQPRLLIAATATLAVLLAAAAFFRRRRADLVFLPLLWLTFISFGWLTATLHTTDPAQGLPADGWGTQGNQPATFVATLVDTPRKAPRTCKVEARVEAVRSGTAWHPADCRMMLYLSPDSTALQLRYGDRLLLHARPQLPNGEENPHQFNYRRHLLHKGIGWQAFAHPGHWSLLPSSSENHSGLVAWSKQLQCRLVRRIQQCRLTPAQQGIAEALLTGWRDDLDPATVQQYRTAGILHLLCVSGLHVGIVAWLAGLGLFFLGRRQWHRVVKGSVQIVAIWLFVLLTGMAPSTLRAGVMFTLLRIGYMAQRQPNSFNNLCTSALLLLLIDPYLLFDVGFQISYAAVAGILSMQDPLEKLLPLPFEKFGHRCMHYIWKLICLTTAAQLGSAPFVLYHFHQFSPWFLVANLLIVPFAGVMLATALGMVILVKLPLLGSAATWLLRQELVAADALTRWVGTLPGANLDRLYCDLPMALLLVIALLLLILLIRCRTRWALPAAAGCLLLAVAHLTAVNIRAVHQHSIVVYNAGRHLAVECFDGRKSYLVCDTSVARNPGIISYQRDGLVLHRRTTQTTVLPVDTAYADTRIALNNHTLRFAGCRLFILDSTAVPPSGCRYDAVVVAPGTRADTSLLRTRCSCDTLLYRYKFTELPM